MNAREADELGARIAQRVQAGHTAGAYELLMPVLRERTPFRYLGRIGEAAGTEPLEAVNAFLVRIARDRTEGGWVVIGTALGKQLDRDLKGALARCRECIIAADVWYGSDILGERVPGPALLAHFGSTWELLRPWRKDANRWVRRAVGVSVHFWAKRTRGSAEHTEQAEVLLGSAEHTEQAEVLLAFLDPMFGEWDMDAVKGVGWGLKTLGRYYPDLVADWLAQQVVHRQRRHRTLMLRKSLTYLSEEHRARATGETA
jgi:hypothetical protein